MIKENRSPELEKFLKVQLYKYEKRFKCDPMMSLERLGEHFHYLRNFIGAIRVHIDRFEVDVQAAFKLSQDQSPWSRNNTIDELTKFGHPGSIATANEMKKRFEWYK